MTARNKKHRDNSRKFVLPTKKSLGQHFLRDPRILQKIADAAKLTPDDTVLEVGPGEGTLTELLLRRAGRVIAVEKDTRLIPFLQKKFAQDMASGKLELVHSDILSFNPSAYSLEPRAYRIVANLPYYITGAFLRKSLQETKHPPTSMTLLLQKEVAKRIVAADGKESVLSISVKAYGAPKYIGTVKAGAFSPPPKVDSAIIAIGGISKKFFADIGCHPRECGDPVEKERNLDSRLRGNDIEQGFFELLKKGFAHPRKFVASNLHISVEALKKCGVDAKARPENLSLEHWRLLASDA